MRRRLAVSGALVLVALSTGACSHRLSNPQAATDALARGVAVGDTRAVQAALTRGADVNAAPEYLGGMTPLTIAAFDGNAAEVAILLRAGANVRDPRYSRALEMALTAPKRSQPDRRTDYDRTIQLLRAAGAKTAREKAASRAGAG